MTKRRGAKLVFFVAIPAVLLLFAYLKEVGDGGWINPMVALGIMGVIGFIILAGLRNTRKEVDEIREEAIQTCGDEGKRDMRRSWGIVRVLVVVFAITTLGTVVYFAVSLDWSQIDRF